MNILARKIIGVFAHVERAHQHRCGADRGGPGFLRLLGPGVGIPDAQTRRATEGYVGLGW